MGVSFYIASLIVDFINQSVLCSTIQQSVKYEDSQHFVSSNLWTVDRLLQFSKYSTNFYATFYATPCVPLWTEKITATLLGYKVQSVAYTEVIHFQY